LLRIAPLVRIILPIPNLRLRDLVLIWKIAMSNLMSFRTSSSLHQQHVATVLRVARAIAIALVTVACACLAGGMADG